MLNRLVLFFTDFLGCLLKILRIDKPIRQENDLRLVFYHGIGDKDAASMTYLNDEIPRHVFKEHINYLQDNYDLLSLKDAVNLAEAGKLPKEKPVGTISFDDGLQSIYTDAYPILQERDIPFDVFVNTSVVGNRDLLWLHALNYLLTNYGPHKIAEVINGLINADMPQAPKNARSLERWCRDNFECIYENNIIGKLFDHYGLRKEKVAAEQELYLTWQQIEEMSANGVGFYSHTHRHYPLNALPNEDTIKTEIRAAHEIMEERQKNTDFVSFPFGMEVDYEREAIEHAHSAGHKFVVEVGNGLNSPEKMIKNKLLSRVLLGDIGPSSAQLYASIEVRPVIKSSLKSLLQRN